MTLSTKIALVTLMVVALVSSSEAVDLESDAAEWIQNQPRLPLLTQCDYEARPGSSCQDCNTRLICTRVGGLLKPCASPFRPYCNNGLCTSIQSPTCAKPEGTTTEPATDAE